MDKKHEIYVKLPVYFGYASIFLPILAIILSEMIAPNWICYVTFFLGFACTIAGLMSAGMKEGQSEEDRRYCRPGVTICLTMVVIYLIMFWFFATANAFMKELFHTEDNFSLF
ncbi:MAG: hypothetical protein J5570_08050 [Lachnospiraceae bacterium]|nr:hypothetical protein [Lachnospiraceae bacterium]